MYKQVKSLSSYINNKIKKPTERYSHIASAHHYDLLLLEVDRLERVILQVEKTIISKRSDKVFNGRYQELAMHRKAINILADLKQIISTFQHTVTDFKINSLCNKKSSLLMIF